ASGLDALQVWITWAWVEAEPGVYRFDDFDALFDEAEQQGLGVIISTVGELHPEWIHRLIPDGAMIDHMGNQVISSHRIESNFGLTPGCCTDHPEVAKRMGNFLKATAEHFKHRPNLIAWDIWNETRWNIHADGHVCHCSHTLAAFRSWLKERYDNLEGLNKAWHRRYISWDDVFPGKMIGRPYTETMAFSAFLQFRSEEHMRFRNNIFRDANLPQPVGAHGATPSVDQCGIASSFQTPVSRGSDWEHAKILDTYGTSFFPLWHKLSLPHFMVTVGALETAVKTSGNAKLWITELQGGAANYGQEIGEPVPFDLQKRWLWSSAACGAKAVIFWSWCNEVFGREATGFGLAGRDGKAEARMEALHQITTCWKQHEALLDAYEPDPSSVGIWFAPENYQLEAAETAQADKSKQSIYAWMCVLEQLHQPPTVVTPAYLNEVLPQLKLLVLPCANVVAPEAVPLLIDWVKAGGTLICEAETDAWNAEGFYRPEPEDRPLMHALGFAYVGRRPGGRRTIHLKENDRTFQIDADWFTTPLEDLAGDARELACDDGEVIAMHRSIGKGQVYALGFYAGLGVSDLNAPYAEQTSGFREWVISLLSGTKSKAPDLIVNAPNEVRWRTGITGEHRLLFLINDSPQQSSVKVTLSEALSNNPPIPELNSGEEFPLDAAHSITCEIPAGDVSVLRIG
ncbi:MAG: beta-galactosidase, partial [Puniceicoccales bacterium]